MMNDAETIARSLSKAQREAVLNYDWKVLPPDYWYLEPTGYDPITHWLLPTDAAVAVRAILKQETPDD